MKEKSKQSMSILIEEMQKQFEIIDKSINANQPIREEIENIIDELSENIEKDVEALEELFNDLEDDEEDY